MTAGGRRVQRAPGPPDEPADLPVPEGEREVGHPGAVTPGVLESDNFRVLVVEDDPAVLELLEQGLSFAGFRVSSARGGAAALHLAAEESPDLVVLDVMLPDIDGFEVCQRLRADGDDVPVIFLTARDAADDLVHGFDLGGDDYVTKPFRLKELVVRILAVLKRVAPTPEAATRHSYAGVVMDETRHVARRGETPLELSPTEFRLLRYFLLNPERVLEKEEILEHVWGVDHLGDHRRVETYVSYLRRKMGEPQLVQTVWGVGYVLRAEET